MTLSAPSASPPARYGAIALLALALALALAAVPAVSAARSDAVVLRPARCATLAPDALTGPFSAFARYAPFVKRCEARRGRARVAVVAVSVNAYYSAQTSPTEEDIPLPVILDSAGTAVGVLPEHFPDHGPLTSTLRACRWGAARPALLTLRFETAAVGDPPRPASLAWNPSTQSYKETARGGC